MISAPLPSDEKQRLEALRKLHLLDTPIEERFERITRICCKALNVPYAAFTLIDETRQWFKSLQNHDVLETPRDIAFCAHTILQNDVLIVPDMRRDTRFRENPLVTGETNINFYAGCPVHSPQGYKVGSLCALDTIPRDLNEDQVQLLRDLAAFIETELRAAMLSTTQSQLIEDLDISLRLSMVDQLTRLWNMRGMHELLKKEWSQAIRDNRFITLAIAEIDKFSLIKADYGEHVSNPIVKTIAQRLLSVMRTQDIIGRIEENKFLLILRNCEPATLQQTVDRLRAEVTRSPVRIEKIERRVTVSFGASLGLPQESSAPEIYVKKAEEALDHARQNGRNRTEVDLSGYI